MADELNDPILYLRDAILEDIKATLKERMSGFLVVACTAFKNLWELDGRTDPLPEALTEDYLRVSADQLINDIAEPGVYSADGVTAGIDYEGAYLNFNCTYEIDFDDEVKALIYLWMKENEEMLAESGLDIDFVEGSNDE